MARRFRFAGGANVAAVPMMFLPMFGIRSFAGSMPTNDSEVSITAKANNNNLPSLRREQTGSDLRAAKNIAGPLADADDGLHVISTDEET
jgi:hypothetical protein